ncbi:hypothetical protein FOA43_003901 [Brettanomyces nanus]|uniref:Phosphatase PP2A regulatory subunit A/Splicing factor 3B subunit 1-like HEAT repeat domain-containing protein n=1 Tax=Eeniella nana TaxID=13502 RepID=A0A875S9K9_EENNA|nr:uncharacterized protein FOA43_003901 [Brettanomyces nanus]QPG76512.1 hypothetical protein FOA43_003901 [Brettanomyces nanus]
MSQILSLSNRPNNNINTQPAIEVDHHSPLADYKMDLGIQWKVRTEYQLAIKQYLNRNFSHSWDIISPLVNTPDYHSVDKLLMVKCFKLYLSLVDLILKDLNYEKDNEAHIVSFPEYIIGGSQRAEGERIYSEFMDGLLLRQIKKIFDYDLASVDPELVLMCFIIEFSNAFPLGRLREQMEAYLTYAGVLEGGVDDSALQDPRKENVLTFYLMRVMVKMGKVEESKDLICRIYVKDDEKVLKFLRILEERVKKEEQLEKPKKLKAKKRSVGISDAANLPSVIGGNTAEPSKPNRSIQSGRPAELMAGSIPKEVVQQGNKTKMPSTASTAVVLDAESISKQNSSNGQVEELYPIALLMDELRHDDVAARVQAMKRLDTISIALGPERTRKELIPFLEDVIPEDEDEVIAIAAEELGKFVPLVGGAQFAPILIPVLEKISACEEPIVREKAVESLNIIAETLSDEQIQREFIPLIQRLAKERWFSLHIAASGLFQSVIIRVSSEMRAELLKLYFDLIQDDSPMVRKSSATELPELIDILGDKFHTPETIAEFHWDIITSMYENLVNDNQDSVKFLAVDVLISILGFLKHLDDKSHHEELFESLLALINDPSWRVRYMVADRFDKLAQNFNDDSYTLKLVPNLLSLMKDNEAEVRKAISTQLPGFCSLANKADRSIMLEDIVPVISQLSMDESETVRSALASEITGLAPIFGKDATIKHLLPIFVEMLKDEFSEVRLNIISKLQVVNEVIGIQLLSESLLPAITSLSNDKLWRVRLAIIEQIPLLAEQLGVAFFDEALGQLCMEWLWDPVYSIREAAVSNLQKLTQFFGEDWSKKELIKRVVEKKQTKDFDNFICRLTCLLAMNKLIPVVSAKTVAEDIYPFIDELKDDQVPNIRFNVAKALASVAEKIYPEYKLIVVDKIRPTLESLQGDDDVDVRFYTDRSLETLSKLL